MALISGLGVLEPDRGPKTRDYPVSIVGGLAIGPPDFEPTLLCTVFLTSLVLVEVLYDPF